MVGRDSGASSLTDPLFNLSLIIFSFFFLTINGRFAEPFRETILLNRMEKMTQIHFYFHDIVSGQNPTAVQIAGPTDGTGFGVTRMMDDPLTEGPELTSKLIGRAQGLYALASQHEPGLLMVLNFAFVDGNFNGSVLSILGRNPFLDTVREMPIVGGTGLFRFARGYAQAKTFSIAAGGNAVVEYNVFVMH